MKEQKCTCKEVMGHCVVCDAVPSQVDEKTYIRILGKESEDKREEMIKLADEALKPPQPDECGWEFELEALIMHYKEHRAADDDFKSFIHSLLQTQREEVVRKIEEMKVSFIDDKELNEMKWVVERNKIIDDILSLLKSK